MMPPRKLRILILLALLGWVTMDLLATRFSTTDWDQALWVGVYPVNADGSTAAAEYISNLGLQDFAGIDAWFATESRRLGLVLEEPVSIRLGDPLSELPPLPPADGGLLATIGWSLEVRWWADRHDRLPNGLEPDIRLYLLYYDPQTHPVLPHSLGLQKGLLGIVHAFASDRQAGQNRVVMVHELLHTIGATDKYNPASNQPLFPQGYAEPGAEPRYPQRFAEIMGGRTPLTPLESDIPDDLDATRIGAATAVEIHWK